MQGPRDAEYMILISQARSLFPLNTFNMQIIKNIKSFKSVFFKSKSKSTEGPSVMTSPPLDKAEAPPEPPPLPTPPSSQRSRSPQPHFKIAENEPGFWQKFKHAQGAFYEDVDQGPPSDPLAPRTGSYFFYGSLMDPGILMELLNLKEMPTLRPANIVGYSCKLWGQYPALVDGPQGNIVEGAVYEVQTEEHAVRLARYETNAYKTAACRIKFTNGGDPSETYGTTFKYDGALTDLKEGSFDLRTWLIRMNRTGSLKNVG